MKLSLLDRKDWYFYNQNRLTSNKTTGSKLFKMLTLNSKCSFALAKIDLEKDLSFEVTNFTEVQVGSFSMTNFWNAFMKIHIASDEDTMIALIADLARCHFSPKPENRPGMKIVMKYSDNTGAAQTHTIDLPKGKSLLKPFDKGQGKTFCYTNACLASAGLFEQMIHSNAKGRLACESIPGNYKGYNQYMGFLDGWTQADQDASNASFETFIQLNNCSKRDAAVDKKIKAASALSIHNRINSNQLPALSLQDVLRVLVLGEIDETTIKKLITKQGGTSVYVKATGPSP